MSEIETRQIGQLPTSSAVSGAALMLVQEPAGPAQTITVERMLGLVSLSGVGAPAAGLGVKGSFYYDRADPDALVLYGPKTDAGWGSGVLLKAAPSAAGNVASTLAQLRAAAITNDTMLFDGRPFRFTTGDFTGLVDDVNTVQSNLRAINLGAWRSEPRSRPLLLDQTSLTAIEAGAATSAYVPEGVTALDADPIAHVVGPGAIAVGGEVRNLNDGQSMLRSMRLFQPGSAANMRPLRRAMRRRRGKVLVVGDSMAECRSQIAWEDGWACGFEQWVRAETPGIEWTFSNLSIPGRDIPDLRNPNYKGTSGVTDAAGFNRVKGSDLDWPVPQLWRDGSTLAKSWSDHARDEQADALRPDDTEPGHRHPQRPPGLHRPDRMPAEGVQPGLARHIGDPEQRLVVVIPGKAQPEP